MTLRDQFYNQEKNEHLRLSHHTHALAYASAVVEQYKGKPNIASKTECAFWGLFSYLKSIYTLENPDSKPNDNPEILNELANKILTFDQNSEPELFNQQQKILQQHPNSSIIGVTAHILTQERRENEINDKILNPRPEMIKNFQINLHDPNQEHVGRILNEITD